MPYKIYFWQGKFSHAQEAPDDQPSTSAPPPPPNVVNDEGPAAAAEPPRYILDTFISSYEQSKLGNYNYENGPPAREAATADPALESMEPLSRVPSHRAPIEIRAKSSATVKFARESAAANESPTGAVANPSSPGILERVLEAMRRRLCPHRPLVSSSLSLPPENSADLSSSPEKESRACETYIQTIARRLGYPYAAASSASLTTKTEKSVTTGAESLRECLKSQPGAEGSESHILMGSVSEMSGLSNGDLRGRSSPGLLGNSRSDPTDGSRKGSSVPPRSRSSSRNGRQRLDGSCSPYDRPPRVFQGRRESLTEPLVVHPHLSQVGRERTSEQAASTPAEIQQRELMAAEATRRRLEVIRLAAARRQNEDNRTGQGHANSQRSAAAVPDPEDLYDRSPPNYSREGTSVGGEIIDITGEEGEEGPTTEHIEYSYTHHRPIDWDTVDLYGVSPEYARPAVRVQPRHDSPLESQAPSAVILPSVDGPSSPRPSTGVERIDVSTPSSSPDGAETAKENPTLLSTRYVRSGISRPGGNGDRHNQKVGRARRLLSVTDHVNSASPDEADYSHSRNSSSRSSNSNNSDDAAHGL